MCFFSPQAIIYLNTAFVKKAASQAGESFLPGPLYLFPMQSIAHNLCNVQYVV